LHHQDHRTSLRPLFFLAVLCAKTEHNPSSNGKVNGITKKVMSNRAPRKQQQLGRHFGVQSNPPQLPDARFYYLAAEQS